MQFADPSQPPPKLRHNRLAWVMACDLVQNLHALPLGLRLPRQKNTPMKPKLSLSDYPQELVDAWEIVKVLLAKGHAAACEEFNKRFASPVVRLPRLTTDKRKAPGERDYMSWVLRPDYAAGKLRHFTFFPPALSVWLVLTEWQVHSRVKQCPECNSLFLDYTRGVSKKYCSEKCASRATSRNFRARRA